MYLTLNVDIGIQINSQKSYLAYQRRDSLKELQPLISLLSLNPQMSNAQISKDLSLQEHCDMRFSTYKFGLGFFCGVKGGGVIIF